MPLGVAIAVNGRVDQDLADATWVEVHERAGRPTGYRLRFEFAAAHGDFERLTDSRLDAGSDLAVLVSGKAGTECLVRGPVVAHRVHFEHGGSGSYVEVRGADLCVSMDREAKSVLWADLRDSDIVTKVVSGYGLLPDVDPTDSGHFTTKHSLAQRESDLSLLRRLARRNGFQFWVTAEPTGVRTGHFRKPQLDGTPALTLSVNREPPTFDSLDLDWDVERPTSVSGKQLDLNTKKDLDASTSVAGLPALGGRELAAITGDTRSILLAAPADDAGDLQARAAGALREAQFFIRASGQTTLARVGQAIRAHTVIELEGAGGRHSGKYYVAGVRHIVDPANHVMEVELLRNAWSG